MSADSRGEELFDFLFADVIVYGDPSLFFVCPDLFCCGKALRKQGKHLAVDRIYLFAIGSHFETTMKVVRFGCWSWMLFSRTVRP